MQTPLRETSIEITPAFYEVDLLQVVWHGNYPKYFERARSALMQTIGYDYKEMLESGFNWPIVDLQIRYSRPARLHQKLKVTASLIEWENRLKINYRIRDAESGELLTKATSVQFAVSTKDNETCFVSPPILFQKLGLPAPGASK